MSKIFDLHGSFAGLSNRLPRAKDDSPHIQQEESRNGCAGCDFYAHTTQDGSALCSVRQCEDIPHTDCPHYLTIMGLLTEGCDKD